MQNIYIESIIEQGLYSTLTIDKLNITSAIFRSDAVNSASLIVDVPRGSSGSPLVEYLVIQDAYMADVYCYGL